MLGHSLLSMSALCLSIIIVYVGVSHTVPIVVPLMVYAQLILYCHCLCLYSIPNMIDTTTN